MAKKVTGVAIQLGNRKWRFSEEAGAPMATEQRATLVIGDECVFTESEVRAILQKMEEEAEANMRTSVQFPGHREVDESVVHDLIDEACEAFGIVLDPA